MFSYRLFPRFVGRVDRQGPGRQLRDHTTERRQLGPQFAHLDALAVLGVLTCPDLGPEMGDLGFEPVDVRVLQHQPAVGVMDEATVREDEDR